MFSGATQLSMDVKGRLAIPAKHRDALTSGGESEVVLTAHPHRCLILYPKEAWLPIQTKLTSLSSFNPQTSALQRMIVGQADVLTLDSVGRLSVNPVLRKFARLDKEVMIVGQGSHFELWDVVAWDAQLEKLMDTDNLLIPQELEGFSL
ncbi:MAG TPA: cell division/cell wall cluster transcriptional repressor MraZ [Methylophilaceae bacterium]|nr:cell division/cell wall cluster transcriptional repressor MraZ [Methylophilaceae bacterium]